MTLPSQDRALRDLKDITMSFHSVLSLKTDEKLLTAVRNASHQHLSAEQLLEQRVSFVYGSMGKQSDAMTKDQVRQVILEQQGSVLRK